MNTVPPQIQATTKDLLPIALTGLFPFNYNCTLNLSPCYRPNNYLTSRLVTYPSSGILIPTDTSFHWYHIHF